MKKVTCKKCIMDSSIPGIEFDHNGVCTYCNIQERMEKEYPFDGTQEKRLEQSIAEIKEAGRGKQYDCAMGVSGGCDSSYLLYLTKKYGLRVIAFTLDNNWGSNISSKNIKKMISKLDIDLHTHTIDEAEFNDISRSFLYASVPDMDIPSDIAIAKLYYMVMEKYNLEHSICGHSFRTEGTTPLGWTYMDGKYIESVHSEFGKIPIKTLPNLSLDYWLKSASKKRFRMLYYIDYNKRKVMEFLKSEFDWEWYGGHHFENKYTKFVKAYMLPIKFNIDKRYVEFSALVRSGQMNREEALETIRIPPILDGNFIDDVLKRLDLSKEQFDNIINLPIKSYRDYETYKDFFVKNREMFRGMAEKGLIPVTFFEKYTHE